MGKQPELRINEETTAETVHLLEECGTDASVAYPESAMGLACALGQESTDVSFDQVVPVRRAYSHSAWRESGMVPAFRLRHRRPRQTTGPVSCGFLGKPKYRPVGGGTSSAENGTNSEGPGAVGVARSDE